MEELTKLSASKIAELIRTRAVSSVEVVAAHLQRIEELNPHLNAVVTLAPDALDQARRADEAGPRGREPSGAWHGVPVTIKDTIDTGGLRTTRGSKLYANFIPSQDAPAVARLRAAGAIVLGKTNASELALDYTADNLLFGRTNNPQALTHTPGGSSGGCAAAVAACLTPASVGSDLAGSIRIPAHFCGVLALKPTAASISLAGHLPPTSGAFSLGASFGPLARSVDDVELLFNVMTTGTTEKHEGMRMPASVSMRADKSKVSNSTGVPEKVDMRGQQVAWYVDDGCVRVSEETRRAVELAAGALQDAGLVTREERPPGIEHGARVWFELFAPATERFLRASYAGREAEGGPTVQTILARQADKDSLIEPLDKYFRAWMERDYLRARLIEWMNETPLIIAPVGAVAAFAHNARRVKVDEQEVSVFRAFSYAQTFNVFDLPSMCVPVSRSREGLPIGVQIVGRPFAERETFAAARILENAFGGWQMPAGIKAL